MGTYTKPQQWKKEKSERLRGEGGATNVIIRSMFSSGLKQCSVSTARNAFKYLSIQADRIQIWGVM